jgi:hypothetical protein
MGWRRTFTLLNPIMLYNRREENEPNRCYALTCVWYKLHKKWLLHNNINIKWGRSIQILGALMIVHQSFVYHNVKYGLIRIEKPDWELEGVESFQRRIGLNSFGAKVERCFWRADLSFVNSFVLEVITQRDTLFNIFVALPKKLLQFIIFGET